MGEELDPFGQAAGRTGTVEPKSPSKRAQGKRRAEQDADGMDVDEDDAEEEMPEVESEPKSPTKGKKKTNKSVATASDEELDQLLSSLELARDSAEAADCALALLASDRLPKQVSGAHICIVETNSLWTHELTLF